MKKLLLAAAGSFYLYYRNYHTPDPLVYLQPIHRSRKENLSSMKQENYDVLIIGGGVTGAGVALESATRGLKSCLIEKNDFSAQTSSKSAKLLHGGVQYLEKAAQLDQSKENLFLVIEGLRERSLILNSAPHMTSWVSLAIPCKNYSDLVFFFCGQVIYQLLALMQRLPGPPIPWPWVTFSREIVPNLKDNVGSVVYTDGQMNDSRLCVEILTTAGLELYMQNFEACHIANYVEFINFDLKDGKIQRALVKDTETGEVFWVKSKVFINCTGTFSDSVRAKAGCKDEKIVPWKGSHLVLPKKYCSDGIGMLVPKSQNNRVLFLIPWENFTILGATDEPGEITATSKIRETEKQFLINELSSHLNLDPDEISSDVLASFSGERPLVRATGKSSKDLLRSHEIEVSQSGLISVMGGKWTMFRAMAEEAINEAIKVFDLPAKGESISSRVKYKSNHDLVVSSKDLVSQFGIRQETADYLIQHYGTKASTVLKLGKNSLYFGFPFVEGEIYYAIQEEYALHPMDIIARRLRIAFINYKLARELIDPISNIMAKELNWSAEKINKEKSKAFNELSNYQY